MIFWNGLQATLELPEPQQYDATFPNDAETTLTQGGFFIPVGAPDDVEAVVNFSWDALSETQLAELDVFKAPALVSVSDPLDLSLTGYIKSLDSQTTEGRVSPSGGVMYSVQLSVQVINLNWPDVMGSFVPGQRYPPGAGLGISASGRQPAVFAGSKSTLTDIFGWAVMTGGDTAPWGPVVPPIKEGPWDRSLRGRTPPVYGVSANYLAVNATQLTPTKGSVFLAFCPLDA